MKLTPKLFMFVMVILNVSSIAGCSTFISAPTPTAIATNTVIPTITSVPASTAALTLEPSPTATIVPIVPLSTEVISNQNISQIQQLASRELAGKPQGFLPRSMDFTPDGRMVAADFDTIVYVWDGLTGQKIVSMDHSFYLWNVAISPNGKMAASGGESEVIKVWNLNTGEEIHALNHPETIWSLTFSPDNSLLASGSLGLDNVRIWDLVEGKQLAEITDVHVNSLAFSPDGKILAIGTGDKIILWDFVINKPIRTLEFELSRFGRVSGVQGVLISPDGKMIAAADASNIAIVWDISSGKKLSTIVGKGTIIDMSEGTLAFSPDSKMIATGNDDGNVIFWDVLADKELKTIGSLTCIPMDLIFETSGNIFEIACQNGTVQFWGIP